MSRTSKVAAVFAAIALFLFTTLALAQEHEAPSAPDPHAAHAASAPPAAHATVPVPHATSAHAKGDAHDAHAKGGAHDAHAKGDAHDAHAKGGAHGGHHGPDPINWTDIWDKERPAYIALVINFGALATLYYLLGKKPVTEALKQRRVTIGKDIDEAQKLLDEAKERAKKYQADLKNADADAETAKAALVSAGKGEVDRIAAETAERAERMKRDAERLVEQERKQMKSDLHRETVELAVREAALTLEKSVTAEDHARLAQDLLAELAKRPSAAESRARSTGGVA